jgi:CRISPR-associated protein (TIGR03984 family)
MADDAGGFKTAVERDGKTFVEPAGFAEAYEAIVFCEDWELRWVREGLSGTASLLSETPMALDGKKATKIDNVVDKNPISYLVWGKVPEASKPVAKTKPSTPPGWTAVHNSQIGWLLIPATGADEFRLEAKEYFVREEKHGNVAFGFQRLLQFVPGKGGGS